MAKMPEFSGANAQFLPKRTYKDKLTVGSGKDKIDLYYFGRGHTNGDTFVVLPGAPNDARGRYLCVKGAAVCRTRQWWQCRRAARHAREGGGDHEERRHDHQRTHPVGTFNDLRQYADFTTDFVELARASLKAGKTAEQAAGDYKVAPRFKGYEASVNPAFGGALANLKIAYGELKK